jgi:uncharacterized protein
MLLTTYQNAPEFVQRTRPTLEKNEVANSLILGITLGLANAPADRRSAFYLATVEDEEHTLLAAACMTPPYNIALYSNNSSGDEEAFALLAQNLQDNNWSVPGAIGTGQVIGNFAQIWSRRTGQRYKEGMRQRIFELSQVLPPRRVEGTLRVATESDLELISQWAVAFNQEALHKSDSPAVRQEAEHRVRKQMIYVWELPDGRIVTMAGKTRPISQVISIALVYTPPAYRGAGYASNCVAALSQHLLDEGWKTCSLVTDLANPTSNSIYQKIGYRPVCDLTEYVFAARPATP